MTKSSRCGLVLATIALSSWSLGCSEADEDGGGGRGGDPFGNGGGGNGLDSTGNPIAGGQGGANNGDGTVPLQDLSGDVEISGSFIWIANSDEGTVSKIDTRTLTELGRYLTSPSGTGFPSRTSVAASGAVAIANRGGIHSSVVGGGCFSGFEPACATQPAAGSGEGETGITKIWAGDCKDQNGDGVITTSSGRDDILAWGTDECMAWHTPIPEYSNRPVAWAPPVDPDSELEMLWTAGATNCMQNNCTWNVYRLNGDTGQIQDTVNFSGMSGMNFVAGGVNIADNYGPYGGASDSAGNFWGFVANTTHLFYVDAATLQTATWPLPMASGYGLTIGSKGRIFLCHTNGVTRFDPGTATFSQSVSLLDLGYNGCMTDGAGTLWVGGGVDEGLNGLHSFNTETLEHLSSHDVGAVKGVSIDIDGMVWGVGGNGSNNNLGMTGDRAFKLNPSDGSVETFTGLVGAYTYSDMTGFGLAQAGYVPVVLE